MLNRCDPNIASVLARLESEGLIASADRWMAQLLAAESKDHRALIAALVALLGRLRDQGHTGVPLDLIEQQAIWPQLVSAFELNVTPSAERLRATGLVEFNPAAERSGERPLLVDAGRLMLERLWHYEADLAKRLLPLALSQTELVTWNDGPLLDSVQQQAVNSALNHRLTIVSGGPGTGKTTVAAAIIGALLDQQLVKSHRLAIAAPTGKAASRLQQVITSTDLSAAVPQAQTIHRLLGLTRGRDAHYHPLKPLPFDAVLLDEASMIDLELMYQLLRALRPDARLIMLGDKHQLAAVGAGNVLAEMTHGQHPISQRVTTLQHNYRFGDDSALGQLASAVLGGQVELALELLTAGHPALNWQSGWQAPLSSAQSDSQRASVDAVQQDLPSWLMDMLPSEFLALPLSEAEALQAVTRFRVLCAHRHGPLGSQIINQSIRDWLAAPTHGRFSGELLMVSGNDYQLGVFNGDQAVVRPAADGQLQATFAGVQSGELRSIAARRLERADSAWALTVHKSQGSEFDRVVLVLPEAASLLATRELLYTGITRARESLVVIGDEASIRQAIATPERRLSGLGQKLRKQQ